MVILIMPSLKWKKSPKVGWQRFGDKFVIAEVLLAILQGCEIVRSTTLATVPQANFAVLFPAPFRGPRWKRRLFRYDVPLYHGDFVTTEAGTGFVMSPRAMVKTILTWARNTILKF